MNRTTDNELSPAPGVPMGMTVEMPVSTPELLDALRHDREDLMRDALLSQRRVRYLGLLALLLLALALGEGARSAALLPLAAVALAYVICVALVGERVRRAATVYSSYAPAILVAADVAALAAIVGLSGGPEQAPRILIGALLIVQLAVFYFGRWLGTFAALLSVLGYAAVALGLSLPAAATAVGPREVAFTAGLFGLVSALLISAYGSFRRRMNELRLFCKLVEEGDPRPVLPLEVGKRPDDLSLLAKSLDAMRTRLAEQIGTDSLTGCLNRRALETRLRMERRQAKRRGTTLSVLAIDIDHFKQINDTHGHPFGDVVLREVAEIMKGAARAADAVARMGGDEFVVLLPDTDSAGALDYAERIRRGVAEHTFASATATMPITISVGTTSTDGREGLTSEVLLEEADQSLYRAKSAGRNRVFA